MRLNGRKAILFHLGRSALNRRGWRAVRRDYAPVLRYLPNSRRVWTTSQELDAFDRARSLSVGEVVKGVNRDAFGGTVGGVSEKATRDLLKVVGLTPGMLKPGRNG